jgi:hypothetical protein
VFGPVRPGMVGSGTAVFGRAWWDWARLGTAWRAPVEFGEDWLGEARRALVWSGLAQHGVFWRRRGFGEVWRMTTERIA